MLPTDLSGYHSEITVIIWAVIGFIALGAVGYLVKLGINQLLRYLDNAIQTLTTQIIEVNKTLVRILEFIAKQAEKNDKNEQEHSIMWEDIEKQWEDIRKIQDLMQKIVAEHNLYHPDEKKAKTSAPLQISKTAKRKPK